MNTSLKLLRQTCVTLTLTAKSYYILGVGKQIVFESYSTVVDIGDDSITYIIPSLYQAAKDCIIDMAKELEFIDEKVDVKQFQP